jgi:hypothetical protein
MIGAQPASSTQDWLLFSFMCCTRHVRQHPLALVCERCPIHCQLLLAIWTADTRFSGCMFVFSLCSVRQKGLGLSTPYSDVAAVKCDHQSPPHQSPPCAVLCCGAVIVLSLLCEPNGVVCVRRLAPLIQSCLRPAAGQHLSPYSAAETVLSPPFVSLGPWLHG